MTRTPTLALLLLASCATAPKAPPLPGLTLASITPIESAFTFGDPPPRISDAAFDAVDSSDPKAERWLAECSVVSFERDEARELGLVGGQAFLTSRADAKRFVDELEQREGLIDRATLCLLDGQQGYVVLCNETAYVQSYRIEESQSCAIADPVIGVLQDGMRLELRGVGTPEGPIEVDANFLISHSPKPFPEVSVKLMSEMSPVMIQRPVAAVQHLAAVAELGPDDVLVLAGTRPGRADHRLVVFLTAERVPAGELPDVEDMLPGGNR